jgi:hypothetical protein
MDENCVVTVEQVPVMLETQRCVAIRDKVDLDRTSNRSDADNAARAIGSIDGIQRPGASLQA